MAPRLLKPSDIEDEVWEILTAAREGHVEQIRSALARSPGLVHASYWYTPPIHFAAREGHLDAVVALVAAGADVNYRSSLYGNDTLLQMAVDRGHDDVASYVRDKLRDQFDSDGGKHAVHEAAAAGDLEALETLLEREPALAGRGDHVGRRPLHYAVDAGQRDAVDTLLAYGAAVDEVGFGGDDRLGGDGFRPIELALWHHPYWKQRRDDGLAHYLLARGAHYTITIAAALGDAERVTELLRVHPALANDQESGGKRPLSAASERNHEAIVEMLLEAGADPNLPEGPNCPRGYALWAAARFGYREVAERLLEAGADPNAEVDSSGTPTECATDPHLRALLYRYGGTVGLATHFWKGDIDTVAALLEVRPELFDSDAVRAQAFTHCVSARHEGLLRVLLARGLTVPSVVTYCQSYLWEDLGLARLLLGHGMDPNLPNWQQVRPLHLMAARGEVDAARLFLDHGADPNAVDEEYRSTPLGWAARCGQSAFVAFLLGEAPTGDESKADVPPWAEPLAWAGRRGHDAVVELLSSS